MFPYPPKVEQTMKTLYHSLREKDRRRYAAVEAAKLEHGGIEYIAGLVGCDPKTIRQGLADLEQLPDVPPERCRKKGGAANGESTSSPN
jgi:hypothetical protein